MRLACDAMYRDDEKIRAHSKFIIDRDRGRGTGARRGKGAAAPPRPRLDGSLPTLPYGYTTDIPVRFKIPCEVAQAAGRLGDANSRYPLESTSLGRHRGKAAGTLAALQPPAFPLQPPKSPRSLPHRPKDANRRRSRRLATSPRT